MNDELENLIWVFEESLQEVSKAAREAEQLEAAAKQHREKCVTDFHAVNNVVIAIKDLLKLRNGGQKS